MRGGKKITYSSGLFGFTINKYLDKINPLFISGVIQLLSEFFHSSFITPRIRGVKYLKLIQKQSSM